MLRRLSIGLTLAALLTAPAGSSPAAVWAGDSCFHDMSRPPVTDDAATTVAIGDCSFHPTIDRVAAGTEVTFINRSGQAHEVVGANLTWGAHGKLLEPGDGIGWTFDEPGVYPYTCMIHPGMTGAIVVGDAAAVGTTTGAGAMADSAGGGAPAGVVAAPDPGPTAAVGPQVGLALLAVLLAGIAASVVVRRLRAPASAG
jgi:plastocyanin